MFGKPKPPTEEMIALQEEKDYAGALQLALRYMGETNKPLKKYDPNFLFQTALVYYNLDDILSVEKPSVKLEGVDRIEEIFRITDEIPNDWILYHDVLFLRGRCFLEINRFDEAEEIFSALYSNSIQISLKIIKAFGEDRMKEAMVKMVHGSLTFKGIIAFARDQDPEQAMRYFDTVLEKNPTFELALLCKNDIITIQKGGTGKVLKQYTKHEQPNMREKNS
jgi:tetratricopeptide (TPR) repeat protein